MAAHISFTLVKSGSQFHRFGPGVERITPEAVKTLFDRIQPIPPGGLPLYFALDGREIGRLMNLTLYGHGTQGEPWIQGEAVITDADILAQPWLRLEQIARAAVYFGLEPVR